MSWVLLFGGIALAWLVLLAGLGWWLWRKLRALGAALETLGTRAGELAELVEQVDLAPLDADAGRDGPRPTMTVSTVRRNA